MTRTLNMDGNTFDTGHITHFQPAGLWLEIHLTDGRVCPVLDTTANRLRLELADHLNAADTATTPAAKAEHTARAYHCRQLLADDFLDRIEGDRAPRP